MKKVLSLVLCLFLIACLASPLISTAYAASSDTTVYITRTGECYHNAGCQYLKKSCIPISLGDAVSEGYRACSKCYPPALTQDAPAVNAGTSSSQTYTASSGGSASSEAITITPKATPTPKPTPTPTPIPTPTPSPSPIQTPEVTFQSSEDGSTTAGAEISQSGSSAPYIIAIVGVGAGAYLIGRGKRKR